MRISRDLRRRKKNTVQQCGPTRTSARGWLFLLKRSYRSLRIHGEEGDDGELRVGRRLGT
jgi:hypothetical protein